MSDYIVRRILLLIPTVVVGSMLLFVALTVLPPMDAVELRLGDDAMARDPGLADEQREALGISGPLYEQYVRWASGFVTGDWGRSLISRQPISDELLHRIPVSMELSLIALAATWMISFPLGVFAAVAQDRFPDYFLRTAAYALDALPSFVIGILLLTYLAVFYQWAPPVSFTYFFDDPASHLQIMLLPAFVVGLNASGNLIRYVRTFLLEVLRQDYIRTAKSKGLPRRTVVLRHAMRNVALPLVTIIGIQIPTLLTSSAIIENLFSLPGMGRYLVQSARTLDYPVVMTTTMFFGIIVLVTQLIVDISYAWLDPRVSYARERQ